MAVKVFVESVRINLATSTRVVLLKDSKIDRYLLIHIGEWESFAIAAELQGHHHPRPLTHDLITNILERLDARIVSILIHSLRDDVFFATLTIEQGEQRLEIDARPSDSIALAVRCDAPIFVEEDVFEQAGLKVPAKSEDDGKLAVFRDFVNQLDF
jgi:bifunctional DNase/RNase